MKLLPAHVEGARGMLKLSRADLAALSGVDEQTIWRFEAGRGAPREETLWRLQSALEQCGIEFMNSGSPGVRYHPSQDRRRLAQPESAKPTG